MTRGERDTARDSRESLPERGWMDLALAAYAEPLVQSRSVLFVGDPQSPVVRRLGEGALRLEIVPTGSRQRPSRSTGGTLRSHATSGEWDLVFLADASGLLADPIQLRDVSEALSGRGVALLVVDADVMPFVAVQRTLRDHFAHVRMLGQAPFAGHSIVDFLAAQRDPSLAFDGSLVGDEGARPARFVAVCGAREVTLDAHAIIQVPVEERDDSPRRDEARREDSRRDEARREESRRDEARREEARREEARREEARREEARRELDAARARLEHTEKRLEQAQREIARSGSKLDELRHELARAQGEVAAAVTRAGGAEARQSELESALETSKRELAQLAAALREAEAAGAAEPEVEALERSLQARARENVELRAELERRAVLVRDLIETRTSAVVATEAPPESSLVAELRQALVVAQRRAVDAEAARASAVFARDEAAAQRDARASELAAATSELSKAGARAAEFESKAREVEELRAKVARVTPDAAVHARCDEAEARATAASSRVLELEALLDAAQQRQHADAESFAAEAGKVRGYQARVAELEELRGQLEARVEVLLADASDAREALRLARRDAELASERHELALSEARALAAELAQRPAADVGLATEVGTPAIVDAEASATREGRLFGALARVHDQLSEAESVQRSLTRELTALRIELESEKSARLEERAESMRVRIELEARAATLEGRTATLESQLQAAEQRAQEIATELAVRIAAEADLAQSLEVQRAQFDAHRTSFDAQQLAAAAEAEARRLADIEVVRRESEGRVEAALATERAAFDAQRVDALRSHTTQLDQLQGEVRGLRFVVRDLEAALASVPSSAGSSPNAAEVAELRDRLELVREAHQASLTVLQGATARAESEAQRSIEFSQRVLALDGLVGRLQSALAQEHERARHAQSALTSVQSKLAEAVEARESLEAVHAVRLEEERRAVAGVEDRIGELEAAREVASTTARSLRAALAETKTLLAESLARMPQVTASDARGASDEAYRERLDEMRRAVEDRDILLRSFTAQLQDKDDRIRGLEQVIREHTPAQRVDADALRASVSERDERIARLRGELDELREGRKRLEELARGGDEREAEVRRLQGVVDARDAQLMASEERALAADRERREMREAFAAARGRLETLLGQVRTSEMGDEFGDHAAELLRVLRRFG